MRGLPVTFALAVRLALRHGLTGLHVRTARHVDWQGPVFVGHLQQSFGTGRTTFAAPVVTEGGTGLAVDLRTARVHFQDQLTTGSPGEVLITVSDGLELEAGADFDLAGPLRQVGSGVVQNRFQHSYARGRYRFPAGPVLVSGGNHFDTGSGMGDIRFS